MLFREIAGKNILVPVAGSILNLNALFVITEIDVFILNLLHDVALETEILSPKNLTISNIKSTTLLENNELYQIA